ncbi:MAG: FapA family protein [Phycisphaerae bacterium]|nr:FapA family protein [Phycisphaerae bacterium]
MLNGHASELPVIAEGTAPELAETGYFQWNEKYDPEKLKENPHHQNHVPALKTPLKIREAGSNKTHDPAAKEQIKKQAPDKHPHLNFYEISSLIIVTQGDHLGTLHPTTTGKPGQDVFGNSIDPGKKKEFIIMPGDNVEARNDGHDFYALSNGMPKLKGNVLSVDPTLNIESDVDFSTGNIHYSGDITIKGDIKDIFVVKTDGNITVEGTVEAAQIECGGSLTVKRGILGKEKGSISVGGNLTAKYLSNVKAWVKGDVVIHSEIVNTELYCAGNVTLEIGALHGGKVTAAGTITAPEIGSAVGVRTILQPATDPFLERQIQVLKNDIAKMTGQINKRMPAAQALLAQLGGKTNDKLKGLADEIKTCKEKIKQSAQVAQQMERDLKNCTGTVIVHKTLHTGVVLVHQGQPIATIKNEMIGPLEIVVNPQDNQSEPLSFRVPTGK